MVGLLAPQGKMRCIRGISVVCRLPALPGASQMYKCKVRHNVQRIGPQAHRSAWRQRSYDLAHAHWVWVNLYLLAASAAAAPPWPSKTQKTPNWIIVMDMSTCGKHQLQPDKALRNLRIPLEHREVAIHNDRHLPSVTFFRLCACS